MRGSLLLSKIFFHLCFICLKQVHQYSSSIMPQISHIYCELLFFQEILTSSSTFSCFCSFFLLSHRFTSFSASPQMILVNCYSDFKTSLTCNTSLQITSTSFLDNWRLISVRFHFLLNCFQWLSNVHYQVRVTRLTLKRALDLPRGPCELQREPTAHQAQCLAQ